MVVGRVQLQYLIAFGCLLTSTAPLLFARIDTSKSFWAFGFPAATLVVVGADFVFAGGSVYVAKLAQASEQSLAGGLFQTLRQLGTAFGLTITTTIYNEALGRTGVDNKLKDPPREALLTGFRAAQWGAFAFPILSALISLVFLRGSGIIGHRSVQETRKQSSAEKV